MLCKRRVVNVFGKELVQSPPPLAIDVFRHSLLQLFTNAGRTALIDEIRCATGNRLGQVESASAPLPSPQSIDFLVEFVRKPFCPCHQFFEQEGVDMRIGIVLATSAERQSPQRILLVSADTDMIPAMKQARKSGFEVGLVQLPHPAIELHSTLNAYCDFVRHVSLP